ncbi:xanthine dehydrogenase small subunit [Roseateles aquatilis]|uniref:Xanthine dehydrogenase small subunit n=1 Tax=Roseateles aquatilis TaxID=431061 RepID=A0A246JLR9_9BURK|nr:xanthine dehydrogenase small subunit [Roseateles aquatilis]OWQ93490.1 xanthine dehydrogenase small subunit [Roseateles aquatilis]
MSSPRPLRFVHQGRVQSVTGLPPTTTVLQYLREHARCAGTKEGCAEGDCGACTVLVGELDADGDALALRNVNACIQLLPMLDGKALLTVEDLGDSTDLNPVQQALVDCHGSQCGFCTPGFAMTMQAIYERHQADGTRPTRQDLADDLAGNLCRCTGYRPILDAGERMFDAPIRLLDRGPIVDALRELQHDAPLHYEAPSRAGTPQRVFAPRSLDDFAALREAMPQARVVAGATDVGLWVNKQQRELGDVILTGRVEELRRIDTTTVTGSDRASERVTLRIGAAVPLEEAWAALTAHVPALRELWLRFASPPVRHAGTLGGNIANGSPIGDGPPALIALGARIVLRRGATQRTLPLEDFYLDYMKNALQPGEFVEALEVPSPPPGTRLRGYKIAKRYDSDISAVCAVLSLRLEDGVVRDARFAFGGMAAIVKRAAKAESAVTGRAWDEAAQAAAARALDEDFRPLTDLRASAGYRQRVAANLVRRFWLETRANAPIAAEAGSVWQAVNLRRSVA